MFPMKTTAKTIFSLMAAGFVLTTISARSSAQTSATPAEKPLSPQIMKILCERSPLNSRCAGGSGSPGSASTPATPAAPPTGGGSPDTPSAPITPPTGSGSPDGSPSAPTVPPAGGATTPSGEITPSTPAPTIKEPAGGSTLPPGTPGGTKSEPTPVVPAPQSAPAKPYQSSGDKLSTPVGPSSTLPSVPNKISAEPASAPKSSGTAAQLVDPAKAKAPAAKTPSSDTLATPVKPSSPATKPSPEKTPTAQTSSPSLPDGGSKPSDPVAPIAPATTPAPAGGAAEAPTSSGTVVEVVGSNAKLSTLSAALKAAGLDKKLAGKGPFTIFAPSDEAFAALPPEALQDLLKPENKAKLAQLLTYHVVSGKVESKALKSGETATVQGKPVTVKVEGSQVMINDATVTQADVSASNGVIHVIDKVILPSAG